jgi:hypothetical protein
VSPYTFHFACFWCRRSFKREGARDQVKLCPNCGKSAINLGRHFNPPKRSDTSQWAKAEFLVRSGFLFQHVYNGNHELVPYPSTLKEAEVFVERYRDQAWKDVLSEVLAALPAA